MKNNILVYNSASNPNFIRIQFKYSQVWPEILHCTLNPIILVNGKFYYVGVYLYHPPENRDLLANTNDAWKDTNLIAKMNEILRPNLPIQANIYRVWKDLNLMQSRWIKGWELFLLQDWFYYYVSCQSQVTLVDTMWEQQ